MARILIESRPYIGVGSFLNKMADVCRAEGHTVVRWLTKPWLASRLLVESRADLAIVGSGIAHCSSRWVPRLQRMRAALLFVEIGWYPQKDNFQVDPCGVNALASWVSQPLAAGCRTPLSIRATGPLLVTMQADRDTQLLPTMSPWFPNMRVFVEHLANHSRLPLLLRAHPKYPADPRLVAFAAERKIPWDTTPTLRESLQNCRAVAMLNSSCGVEAIDLGVPVLCFGRANYRFPGAVIGLDDNPQSTANATEELLHGRSSLFVEPMREVVQRVRANQWKIDELPERLPPLVRRLLADTEQRRQVTTSMSLISSLARIPGKIRKRLAKAA